jgi:hypothetical protein
MIPSKPQENELPEESSCHCLKPKYLPVRAILLMQNIITKNMHNLWLLETVMTRRPLPIRQ